MTDKKQIQIHTARNAKNHKARVKIFDLVRDREEAFLYLDNKDRYNDFLDLTTNGNEDLRIIIGNPRIHYPSIPLARWLYTPHLKRPDESLEAYENRGHFTLSNINIKLYQ